MKRLQYKKIHMLKFTVNKDISQAKYMASDDLESG